MCGFIGIASTRRGIPLPHERREIERMRDSLLHRGPDAEGLWVSDDGRIALGHRRLRVIDLVGGAQPMAGRGGRLQLVYNGEIYNYRELRTELEKGGRRFSSQSDTEVLLAAYEAWGEGCVERFNGIFAFAVVDLDLGSVFAARDPFGVKPLYYGWWDERLYVASEAKAIVADPRVPRLVDPLALDLFFHEGYVPAPRSIWQGMRKLPAGSHIRFPIDGDWTGFGEPVRYDRPPFPADDLLEGPEERILDELEEVLRTAVSRQVVSDVPLGAFLSGGIDSSLVVGYLAELSREPVRTFSVSFRDDANDEAHWARAVSERYRTRHERIVIEAEGIEDLESLAWAYDEPFADPAAVPTAAVSAVARRSVTVALSGDGGDETHAGYPRYRRMVQQEPLDRIPQGVRAGVLGPLAALAPSYKRRGGLEQGMRDPASRFDAMTWEIPPVHRRALYSARFREALRDGPEGPVGGIRAWRRRVYESVPEGASTLDRFQYLDLATLLPERLMPKVDRASMRVSLEARVPFLDPDAVRFAARIPPSLRIHDGRPKYVLRRLLARRMGDDFVDRRKQGFSVPTRRWIETLPEPALVTALLPPGVERWLDRSRIRSRVVGHRRGRGLAWPLLAFAHWVRAYEPTA